MSFFGKINRFFSAVLCILILLTTMGCQETENEPNNLGYFATESASSPKIKGEVSVFSTKVDTLNPLTTKNYYVSSYLMLIFEGLTKFNDKNVIQPVLAESWHAENENKTWFFKLKDNVKFHNNKNLSVNDVIKTYKYVGSIKSPYFDLVRNIKSIKETEKNTVCFELKNGDPDFPNKTIVPILSANQIRNSNNLTKKPIGTGPYIYEGIKKGIHHSKRNAKWHMGEELKEKYNVRPPFIKKVKLRIIQSEKLAVGAFLRNEIDILPVSDISKVEPVRTGYNTHELITNQQEMLIFNTNHLVLKSPVVRKAMILFINRSTIINKMARNQATVSELPNFPPSTDIRLKTNQGEAEKILVEDKWVKATYNRWFKTGTGSLNFELLVNIENKRRCKIADYLASKYAEKGVVITVKKLSFSQVLSAVKEGRFQIALMGIDAPFSSDLSYFYGSRESKGKLNYSGYSNTQLDILLSSYKDEVDPSKRVLLFEDIKEIIYRDVPAIGLFNHKTVVLTNRNITGFIRSNFRSPYNDLAECFVTY